MKGAQMPNNQKILSNPIVSKPENHNLTRKTEKRLSFYLVERKGRRSILSLLTLRYKLTKLKENSGKVE